MLVVTGEMKHPARFCQVFPFVNFIEGLFHLVGRDICKEAQASGIDAQDRDFLFPYPAGCPQECTVTSDAEDHIGIEVISLEYFQICKVGFCVLLQEIIKIIADTYLCVFPAQYIQQVGYMSRFMFLKCISKKGKSHCLLHLL